MQLPDALKLAIDEIFQNRSLETLRKGREALTQDYQKGKISPFSDETKRLSYLGSRMPATFAAVSRVLEEDAPLQGHLLDLGAGLGAASWAALNLFDGIEKITLVEQSIEAIELGKTLALHEAKLSRAAWIHERLEDFSLHADVAVLSYVLNEMKDPKGLILKLLSLVPHLILIEPGTPKGFSLIRSLREMLIEKGWHIVAPCPHHFACPMKGSDWCHFFQRIERSRIHKNLKRGSLGFEDEKFSYLIAKKEGERKEGARIVKPTLKKEKEVRLSLCTKEGRLEEKVISKKDKTLFRLAKKASWGDLFEM